MTSEQIQSLIDSLQDERVTVGPTTDLCRRAADALKPLADPNLVLMPRELTAENGAKGALSGEFAVWCTVPNPDYDEDYEGDPEDEEPETLEQVIPISWTAIKDIYHAAVEAVAVTGEDDRG